MEPYIKNDAVISLDNRKSIEDSLKGHCQQFGRILKIGEKHDHWSWIEYALVNIFGGGFVTFSSNMVNYHFDLHLWSWSLWRLELKVKVTKYEMKQTHKFSLAEYYVSRKLTFRDDRWLYSDLYWLYNSWFYK